MLVKDLKDMFCIGPGSSISRSSRIPGHMLSEAEVSQVGTCYGAAGHVSQPLLFILSRTLETVGGSAGMCSDRPNVKDAGGSRVAFAIRMLLTAQEDPFRA